MGASGGGGQSPYERFDTYKRVEYKDYVKNHKSNPRNSLSNPMSEEDYNRQESNRKGNSFVNFKKGTDMGAIQYLFKNNPNHALFQKNGDAQIRRDAGGNDAIMFDNQGKLDDVAHNALYEGGSITNRESRAYKESLEVQEGAASNKKKKAAPIATAKGSKSTTGGVPAANVQGASQPGSILGGVNKEAVKTLLGV